MSAIYRQIGVTASLDRDEIGRVGAPPVGDESEMYHWKFLKIGQKGISMGLSQHPRAKRYRPFTGGELHRLRESVKRLGVVQPVIIWQGQVLDGWHRYLVALELGVECPTRNYDGAAEDVDAWLAALNDARRHCSDMQFAMMVAADSPQRPGRGRPQKTLTAVNVSAKTDKQLAAEHGIQPNMLATARKVLASGDDDLVAEATGGSLGRTEARKRLRELEAARRTEEELAQSSASRVDVVVCDVADLLSHVEPESVAAVITDPPWADMQAWEDLARVSSVVLQPGGTLAAMASKEDLPGVLDRRCVRELTEPTWRIGGSSVTRCPSSAPRFIR